jgi:hypothetical protein
MSALARITDSSRTSRHVRKVPISDIASRRNAHEAPGVGFLLARFIRVANRNIVEVESEKLALPGLPATAAAKQTATTKSRQGELHGNDRPEP